MTAVQRAAVKKTQEYKTLLAAERKADRIYDIACGIWLDNMTPENEAAKRKADDDFMAAQRLRCILELGDDYIGD